MDTRRFGLLSSNILSYLSAVSANTSDIVEKEMYTFTDRGDRSITLRPEGTAPVVRAFLEHRMEGPLPVKLFYLGPMFRYERPQAGRYRQFHQFGLEVLGSDDLSSRCGNYTAAHRTL